VWIKIIEVTTYADFIKSYSLVIIGEFRLDHG